MRIIRVFPTRTNLTPDDKYCFFDVPGMFPIPEHDEVHIVTVFTWDIEKAKYMQLNWQDRTKKPVKLGGPAFDDPSDGIFVPGRYLKWGVTFASKGCNNSCPHCLVWRREGKLRELEVICPGNIIQDNNFAQCSKYQRRRAYDMLKTQKDVTFSGGIEATRLTEWDVNEMRNLHLSEIFLACDTKEALKPLEKAINMLHTGGIDIKKNGTIARNKIRCYVFIGNDREENEERLMRVYELGALPFAQLYQPKEGKVYSEEWEQFARTWSRPAATRAHMKVLSTA